MSLFRELLPLFPKKQGIGAFTGLILEVLSNSPIGNWRSPSGATNIHVGTSEKAGAVHIIFFSHLCNSLSPGTSIIIDTPTELAKKIGVARSAVSRTIQELEKVELVECLTPDEKMDRYYRVTETGEKVAEIIEGMGK